MPPMAEQVAVADPKVAPTLKKRRRSWIVRIARILVLVYVGLAVILYFGQTWLIFPGHAGQGSRWSQARATKDSELVTLKTHGGVKVVALFGEALSSNNLLRADASTRPTVIFFYGNASSLA